MKQFQKVRLVTNKYIKEGIRQGDIGVILEVYDEHHFEVEFSDKNGLTVALWFSAVLAFFCKFDFSMIKYSVLWAGTTIFRLSCLSYNIARIFRHVKGGLVRDRL